MHTVTVYGWCDSWQCVAEWTWGQNFNNLATLLGAIATFAAAFLALRFSQAESKRHQSDALIQARLAAIANLHVVTDAYRFVRGTLEHQVRPALDANTSEDSRQGIAAVIGLLGVPLDEVGDDALLRLVSIGDNVAFRISRAFATLAHLREQQVRLQAFADVHPAEATNMGKFRRQELTLLVEQLERVHDDLAAAGIVLKKSAEF